MDSRNQLDAFNNKFLNSEYGLKFIMSCFVNLYLIIQLFDISRNALKLPWLLHTLIALCRDVSIFGLTLYLIILKRDKITSFLLPLIFITLFIPIIISIGAIIDDTKIVPLVTVGQFVLLALRPFLFLFVLCNLDSFYVFKNDIIKTFIGFLVFLVLFSFMIYFFFPSLIHRYSIEHRIGLGNMSVQSGMYLCAYILCFYYFPFKTNFTNWFCILVLLLGILLSVCSTGIFCTFMVTVLFLFDKKTKTRSWAVIMFSIIVITFIIFKYYAMLKPFMDYFQNKIMELIDLIKTFISGDNTKPLQSSSFNTRERQIQNLLENNNKPIDYLFGHGFFSVMVPSFMIENGYFDIYFNFGLFGIVVLIALYIKLGINGLKLFFIKHSMIGVSSFACLILFMVTLCIIDLPPLSLSFIMLFYTFYHEKKYKTHIFSEK